MQIRIPFLSEKGIDFHLAERSKEPSEKWVGWDSNPRPMP